MVRFLERHHDILSQVLSEEGAKRRSSYRQQLRLNCRPYSLVKDFNTFVNSSDQSICDQRRLEDFLKSSKDVHWTSYFGETRFTIHKVHVLEWLQLQLRGEVTYTSTSAMVDDVQFVDVTL